MVMTLALILAAYLVGGIPSGLIIARLAGIEDIRRVGSGNIGATNVCRVAGFRVGVWVYLVDIAKGVLPVLVARLILPIWWPSDIFLMLVALAAIIGHVFPVYLGFRGGKGVNTALGAMVVLMPWAVLICLGVFLVLVGLFRYVSLGSVCAALAFPLTLAVQRYVFEQTVPDVYFYFGILLAVLVLFTHRSNIRRLFAGTESRFSFSSRAGKAGLHV